MSTEPPRLQPLVRARVRTLGEVGRSWVARLPVLLEELAEQWGLELGRSLAGGSASYVVRATTPDGEARVLKVGVPDPDLELDREARTLAAAGGRGYAVLHAHDPERGALLLEALGTSLERTPMPPSRKLEILADTLASAWLVPLDVAPVTEPGEDKASQLGRMVAELDGDPRRCDPRVRDRALVYAARLAGHDGPQVVLHGDPHPANLLALPPEMVVGGATHRFVDPDGFRGDPAYDLGVLVRDWTSQVRGPADRDRIEGYCAQLSARTGIEQRRIWEWGFLERVTTGLYVSSLGATGLGARFLDSAVHLVDGAVDPTGGQPGAA